MLEESKILQKSRILKFFYLYNISIEVLQKRCILTELFTSNFHHSRDSVFLDYL